ncbi:unnamed protein product [Allacma fusca]|uniref:Transmembrane protein 43 n=1 Tax=Allacma fusca TaxID=39272 RepID=A0A8J2M6R1_9HEXA|nr:unnamed protein product [Allacma fusca]
MYRTLYPDAPGLHHAWYSKEKRNGSFALEKCQCMRFQYRYHLDWFKRIFGFIILLISLGALAWNETFLLNPCTKLITISNSRQAVESSQSYHEGMQAVTVLKSPEAILPENDGKLVYVSGYLDIFEPLQDAPYGVSIAAVKLKRRVQMYQWTETKNEQDEELPNAYSSYRHAKEWKDKLIDSSKFVIKEYQNPKQIPIESQVRLSNKVHLGKFTLGPELNEKFNNFIQFTSGERPDNQDIKMHMGLYYHSADIWNPSVGDLRIQFSFAGPADSFVSVIAKQAGHELRSYETESGNEIAFIHEGKRSHWEIFTKEHSTLTAYCWIFRSLTWIFSIFGTSMASKTFSAINRRNPIVQNLMSAGPTKFSIVCATFMCLSTIGSIWFHHKPLFGILLFTFSTSLLLYYALLGSENNFSNCKLPHRKNFLPRYLQD